MNRLTFDGNFCDIAKCAEIPCRHGGSCSQRKTWEKLKAYEDAEEQGLLVRLPCKVGDKVYRIVLAMYNEAENGDLIPIPGGKWAIWEVTVGSISFGIRPNYKSLSVIGATKVGSGVDFTIEDLGKTVFLTREEAEIALEG